jgi:hypothetical protein
MALRSVLPPPKVKRDAQGKGKGKGKGAEKRPAPTRIQSGLEPRAPADEKVQAVA